MKQIMKLTLMLLLAGNLFSSCKKTSTNPESTEPQPVKGYITGKVTDTHGAKLAGVKVFAYNHTFSGTVTSVTDANGNYKLQLDQLIGGSWSVYGQLTKTYNGKTLIFQIDPENQDPLSKDGGVRNMSWKLTGVIPGSTTDSRIGGCLAVYVDGDEYIPIQDIEFTLVPTGPLVDNSTGTTIVAHGSQFPTELAGMYTQQGLRDVAVGQYTITARYKPSNGTATTMKVRLRGTDNYQPNVTADFIQELPERWQKIELDVIK
jgi:hypothetical protein